MNISRFDGYPLQAVRDSRRAIVMTHNAVKGEAEVFATTETDKQALMIVNKVNFFDDILSALMDAHPHIHDDKLRAEIGKIITTATGA